MGASRLAAEARTRLREQLDRVGATPGETAGLQVEVGAPGQVLCAAAERWNADAVVVGAGSAGRSLGLGSTVHHLLRRGTRTVLVVKGSPRIPPQRVLAPVDLSHDAADSLRCGLGLLAGDGYGGLPELVAFHAVDERRGETASRPDENFASFLEEHTADYRGPVRSLVGHGDAVAEILAAGKREQPDLLLLGTHGRSGWQRLRLGSVAEAVLRDSPTSVLVVPPAAAFGSSIAEAVGDWVRGKA
jgi:nucleotide-binding universal stress UspA family protein